MAGDQLQLVVELQYIVWIGNHAVLIGALDIFDIGASEDHRQTRIDALGFQAASQIALSALAFDIIEVQMNRLFSNSWMKLPPSSFTR